MLVLLSRPEGWSQSRSRLGQSVPCNLEPILLDTARRYHEYHATIHWKHESGWSVGIGWLISNRACNSPQRFRLIWTPRGLCLYSSWDCRLPFLFSFFFCSRNSIGTSKNLIWVFRVLVVLILYKLKGGGNVNTISDCVINHELD